METSIVCVGDSLTEGYYDSGRSLHPYTSLWPVDYKVTNLGISGALVSPCVGLWIGESLITAQKKYDIAIFMGGTNDIGHQLPVARIWNSWIGIAEYLSSICDQLVICTIPNAAFESKLRVDLNERIRKWVLTNSHTLVDVENLIKYDKDLYDDRIHFNPAGYDLLGSMILKRIT